MKYTVAIQQGLMGSITAMDGVQIFVLAEDVAGKRYGVSPSKEKDGLLTLQPLSDVEPQRVVPFVTVSNDLFLEMAKVFGKYLTDNGIKPDNQSFTEGKLQATESHLTDLRKILFKELEIPGA